MITGLQQVITKNTYTWNNLISSFAVLTNSPIARGSLRLALVRRVHISRHGMNSFPIMIEISISSYTGVSCFTRL